MAEELGSGERGDGRWENFGFCGCALVEFHDHVSTPSGILD
jgi:hypothetical protein